MPTKKKSAIKKPPSKPTGISPQAALVLDYLTAGRKLTPLIAHMTLGVASLTARIAELRKHGYTSIKDQWEVDHFNRRYKAYWMEHGADVASS